MDKWDVRFANLAKMVSTWSKDPSTQVGAAIIRPDKTVCSVGFNGLPRGVADDAAHLEDRAVKYKCIKHAEENAIFFANERLDGYTIYVYPLVTCSLCAGDVIQKGIKRVVCVMTQEKFNRLPQDRATFGFDIAMDMYAQAGVELVLAVDDGESIYEVGEW